MTHTRDYREHQAGSTGMPPEVLARLAKLPRPALWAMAARFKTVSLSLVPVITGTWAAAQTLPLRLDLAVAAGLGAASIQIGTNLWNDAADATSGVDRADRLGPPRMTALGLLDGEAVRRGAFVMFLIATLAGLWLASVAGWPVIAIGLVSLALGYFYSMGPRPLSGLPFGEPLVIGFFGLVAVSGSAWVQGGNPLAFQTLSLGLMIGLPAAAVLMLNNHRDRAQDARAGRRTLAIVIGPDASRLSYATALFAAFALAIGLAPSLWLVPAAALGLWLAWAMWRWTISARLNRLLGLTALYQGLLLAAAVLGIR